jgi:hypothetical protein
MWDAFLQSVEFSALGFAARSSIWLYPLANITHVIGASLLVGAILVFDILLLRNRFEMAANISRVALGVAATGLALLLITGPVMFSAEATAFGRNPIFLTKMVLIIVGLTNLSLYHRARQRVLMHPPIPPRARLHAGISASVWILAVIAGRSIAYV